MLKKRLTALLTASLLFMATIPVEAKPLRVYLKSKTDTNEVVYINYNDYIRAYASLNKEFRDVLKEYEVAGIAVENDENKDIKVIDYSKYADDYKTNSVKNMDEYSESEEAVKYKNPEKVKELSKDGSVSEEVVEAPDKTEEVIPVDYIKISEARVKENGDTVTIKGTVSGVIGNNVFIQDGTAGIYVYMGSVVDQSLKLGNTVKIKGVLDEYNGLKQIKYVANETVIEFVESGIVPTAKEITADKIGESYESQLISVKNLTITSVGSGTSGYDVAAKDANNNIVNIRVDKYLESYIDSLNFKVNSVIDVTAPVSEFTKSGGATTYQLMLRSISDVTVIKDGNGEIPSTGAKLIRDIQGKAHRSPLENKSVSAVKGVVTSISSVDRYQKGFFMQDSNPDNDPATSEGIFVSYSSLSSIKVGDAVEVNGTVKEIVNGLNEDGAPETVINASKVTVNSSGNKLPDPIVIKLEGDLLHNIDNDKLTSFDINEDAMDYFESLEGMLVKIENPLIVGATEKYGEIYVVPNNGEGSEDQITVNGGIKIKEDDFNPEAITIDDVINQITNDTTKKFMDPNMKIRAGDKFDLAEDEGLVGVMSYGFGKYKVLNTEKLPDILTKGEKKEVTAIEQLDNKLTIATYNVENFHKGVGDRIQKLATTIVENLKTPDIIGLIEIQDNNGASSGETEASESYMALINAIKAAGGPEYSYTDVAPVNNQDGGEPGGNIRPGFIYRKDRVTLVDKTRGTATVGVTVSESGLSVNPGRIDPTNEAFNDSRKPQVAEFEFQGERVFVIANHLNSKSGDESLFGVNQPPSRISEVQRHKQATVINNFVKELQSKIPDANIVNLGDMNDFEFTDTLKILKGNEMINMIEELPVNERFTYNFNGNSQVLDHILVSNNLRTKTIADIVNINSVFTDRVSDHDPVLIQVDLGVKELTDIEILNNASNRLTLGDISAVTKDLILPVDLGNEVKVTWSSSEETIMSKDGKVTRPEVGQNNAEVTLTATLVKGNETVTKTFEVTVLAKVEVVEGEVIFKEDFENISSWANVNETGIFTASKLDFVTGAGGGIQRENNSIVLLATGSNTTNLDMKLDLTNASKAELNFDWSKLFNPANPPTDESNPRASTLKVSYSTDNTNFVELGIAAVVKNNTAIETGKFNVALPEEAYGKQITIRFTSNNNGDSSGKGNRPKIAIDNILVK